MPTILGIESTCDETAAAIVVDGWDVRSSVVSSQVDLHRKFRGVVPEIASRAHIENILPVVRAALENASCELADIDAIAVAHRPGLIGSLLIGVTAAKTLAWSLAKPLIGIDHVQAHLYSVTLELKGPRPFISLNSEIKGRGPFSSFPAVGLVVSGGHTALYRVESWSDIALIGSTIDDAVGEAYDKVAAILGLGYPGGPVVDRLAREGDPSTVRFPRSMLDRESLDFSFSGLKTAVLYHVRGVPGKNQTKSAPSESEIRNICASFQAACVETILEKLRRALRQTGGISIVVGGGVSANSALREALKGLDVPVLVPPLKYCTDNAAMSAGLAAVYLAKGQVAKLDLDAITFSQFKV
jgi:N6-L-threonylcarbamoyladenine synthase